MAEAEQPQNLNEFAAYFQNVRSLLFICAMSDQPDQRQGSASLTAASQSRAVADSFAVGAVTYRSPVEMLLWGIGTGFGGGMSAAVYSAATKMLHVWDRWNESRVKHSNANLEIAKNELEQDKIRYERMRLFEEEAAKLLTQEVSGSYAGSEMEKSAAKALIIITGLEVESV